MEKRDEYQETFEDALSHMFQMAQQWAEAFRAMSETGESNARANAPASEHTTPDSTEQRVAQPSQSTPTTDSTPPSAAQKKQESARLAAIEARLAAIEARLAALEQ